MQTQSQIALKLRSAAMSLRAAAEDLENQIEPDGEFADEDAVRGALTHAEIGVNNIKRLIADLVGSVWG